MKLSIEEGILSKEEIMSIKNFMSQLHEDIDITIKRDTYQCGTDLRLRVDVPGAYALFYFYICDKNVYAFGSRGWCYELAYNILCLNEKYIQGNIGNYLAYERSGISVAGGKEVLAAIDKGRPERNLEIY